MRIYFNSLCTTLNSLKSWQKRMSATGVLLCYIQLGGGNSSSSSSVSSLHYTAAIHATDCTVYHFIERTVYWMSIREHIHSVGELLRNLHGIYLQGICKKLKPQILQYIILLINLIERWEFLRNVCFVKLKCQWSSLTSSKECAWNL